MNTRPPIGVYFSGEGLKGDSFRRGLGDRKSTFQGLGREESMVRDEAGQGLHTLGIWVSVTQFRT